MQKLHSEVTTFRVLALVSCLAAILFCGCTPSIYGIPQPEWQKLTDGQKEETIRGYNAREKMREQARLIEIERQAKEAEIRAAEERRQQELMQRRIEGIYRGDEGQYGDLIRVTLRGGMMRINGREQGYRPVALKLANGETRKIDIVSSDQRYYTQHEDLMARYQDGTLFIDLDESTQDRASRLVYDSSWKNGNSYMVNGNGEHQLRNVRGRVDRFLPML